jgi:hypothetical protein
MAVCPQRVEIGVRAAPRIDRCVPDVRLKHLHRNHQSSCKYALRMIRLLKNKKPLNL